MRWAVACLLLVACDPGVRLGAACALSGDCPAPYVCGFGRCRPECRVNRDCVLGATCLLDDAGRGTCSLDLDRCGDDSGCPSGLVCVDGVCSNACAVVAECPPDSLCVAGSDRRARCIRDDADAGAPPDGGASCPPGPTGCDPVAEVRAGSSTACARTESGAVWCWGSSRGVVGSPGDACAAEPCAAAPVRARWSDEVGVEHVIDAISMSVGNSSGCAVLRDHRVVCWGMGRALVGEAEMPLAHLISSAASTRPIDDAEQLWLGSEFAIATRTTGAPISWGENEHLQVEPTGAVHPRAVDAIHAADGDLVALGESFGCASRAGAVHCWGDASQGQVGAGIDPEVTPIAADDAAVMLPGAAIALGAGENWACASTGPEVRCWGGSQALGIADPPAACGTGPGACATVPVVAALPPGMWTAIAGGEQAVDACAQDQAGALWCWGPNNFGVVGGAGGTAIGVPVRRAGLRPVAQASIGNDFACALLVDGEVWCWGQNDAGQLGRGEPTLAHDSVPAPVRWPAR